MFLPWFLPNYYRCGKVTFEKELGYLLMRNLEELVLSTNLAQKKKKLSSSHSPKIMSVLEEYTAYGSFNMAMYYSISGMLRKVNLEMTVLDYDRIGGSDPIGKVLLGYNRKKLEKKHWAEMVDNPRRPVIHWHVLQVS